MSTLSSQIAPGRIRDGLAERRRVTAVLGPTNTGKTHLAIDRMMAHESGMIGLPLRLLAREVYDRVVKVKGQRHVALITGEEKIVPPAARYFICTVEAMPLEREVEFLAIDEIQLAADRERGHTFTDRLLRARGLSETMMLGSETARGLIAKLLPGTQFIARPRFSELSWTGSKKITRLPRRSAVVAFSADRVYEIAELIRRQRGGAAVVMGALSPRTRNAQVALYQSGEVDFLVATDAIGMGLNMDVDHVAFASTQKFDGYRHRPLHISELAQIAGRAGRYMNNGTFGLTGDAAALSDETVSRIENHQFEPDRVFQWRNPHPDFTSMTALLRSLELPPGRPGLARAPVASDLEALTRMNRDPDIQALARSPAALRRLWEVAQVPDFRKTLASEHATLLTRLYLFLMAPGKGEHGHIPGDWLDRQMKHLDRSDGDIDVLSARLAHIRTWTYVANRADWLHDPRHWQERALAIEDRLSDALHERLTQRFIDRRTSVLMKRLRQNEDLMAAVNSDGEVLVEGEFVGRLQGFIFVPDPRAEGDEGRVLRTAAAQALAGEIAGRAQRLVTAPDANISLSEHARIMWAGHPVAQLKAGDDCLAPRLDLVAGEELNGPAREAVQTRLEAWLKMHIVNVLSPLVSLRDATDVEGLARGVAFRLVEHLGSLPRERISEDVRALDQAARGQLRKYGVRFGAYSVFMPALLKPAPARLLLTLWTLTRKDAEDPFAGLPSPPAPGLTSVPADAATPPEFYAALGFRVCGARAVRLDMLERIADLIRPVIAARSYNGGFVVTPDMMSLVGCSGEEFAGLLRGLGYRSQVEKVTPPKPEEKQPQEEKQQAAAPNSPAPDAAPAELAELPTAESPGEEPAPEAPAEAPSEAPVEAMAAEETPPESVQEPAQEPAPEPVQEPAQEPAPGDEIPAATPEMAEPQPAATPAHAEEAAKTETDAKPETQAAAGEPVEMEIWRPVRRKHTGRPRSNQKRAGQDNDGQKKPRSEKRRDDDGRERPAGKPPRRGPRIDKPASVNHKPREREPDPDSPFAALAVLKERARGN